MRPIGDAVAGRVATLDHIGALTISNNLLRKTENWAKFIPMTGSPFRIGPSERSRSGLLTPGKGA